MRALEHADTDEDNPGLDLFVIISDPESDPGETERYEHVFNGCWPADFTDIRMVKLQNPKVFSMQQSIQNAGHQPVECVFIALGWLADHETVKRNGGKKETKKRTTNYVVLLNLSTEPALVWLIYDYHILDYLDAKARWTNQIRDIHSLEV